MNEIATIATAAGLAWASGIRLYALIFIIGGIDYFGWFTLPKDLDVLSHPLVLVASGLLLVLESFADKIPGIDSIWDAIHTAIRIPAGALLAAGVIGTEDGAAWAVAAGLLGGAITAGTHFTKAGSRALINTSPEPVSNWTASFAEEAVFLSGLWLIFTNPVVFLVLLTVFLIVSALMLRLIWRGTKLIIGRFAFRPKPSGEPI